MAASLVEVAKEKSPLRSRIAGATATVKGLLIKGLLAKEAGSALVLGGVLLALMAAFLGLSKLLDPALAAAALAALIFAGFAAVVVVVGRRRP